MKKRVILILIVLWATGAIFAQSEPSFQTTNNASAYSYGGAVSGAEQLKIYTYVWGQVRKPGLYIVPDDIDLLALISLAGGPTENAKLTKVKIIRPTADGEKIIIVNIKEYMESGDEKIIPIMKPGDTIIL